MFGLVPEIWPPPLNTGQRTAGSEAQPLSSGSEMPAPFPA
jgi:hypothetical protein